MDKEQRREYNRRYYEANAEKCREASRKWWAANRERVRQNAREWRKNNAEHLKAKRQATRKTEEQKDKRREYAREWARKWRATDAGREKSRQQAREWASAHLDQCLEKNRRYREAHPEKVREWEKRTKRDPKAVRKAKAKYRDNHRQEIRDKSRQDYQKKAPALREKQKQYRTDNKERLRETAIRSRQKHIDKRLAKSAEYRRANRDELAQKYREYVQRNPEKRRQSALRYIHSEHGREVTNANLRNRRARLKSVGGKHTAADVRAMYEAQNHLCASCSAEISNKKGPKKYHVDHIMPIARGGSNDPSNLQLLCPTCNQRKNAKHPDEWNRIRSLGEHR